MMYLDKKSHPWNNQHLTITENCSVNKSKMNLSQHDSCIQDLFEILKINIISNEEQKKTSSL